MKILFLVFVSFFISSATFSQDETREGFIKKIHIGTNFASLFRNESELTERGYITTNPYINLEGMFTFHPRFSIRIPIGYGLNSLDGNIVEGGDLPSHWFETGPDPEAPFNPYQDGPRLDSYRISSQILCNNRCTKPIPRYIRPHYLKYQIGVFPRFVLHNWEKVSLSITAGANFGIMDEYAVSEYSSFSSVKNGDTITAWSLNNQRIEFETNTFLFVRPEVLLGIDIKLSNRFSLTLETGFAQRIRGQGEKPDKIYTNLDNAGYNLILSDYDDTEQPYYNSLSLFQKLGSDVFINRFSLRFHIK